MTGDKVSHDALFLLPHTSFLLSAPRHLGTPYPLPLSPYPRFARIYLSVRGHESKEEEKKEEEEDERRR